MKTYLHKVSYYETDKMGITHHSNYIRWMEEARVNFMDQVGYSYQQMEADGIISPVVKIDCQYKKSTTFNDIVEIHTKVKEYTGIKLVIEYEMLNQADHSVCLIGTSEHCFLSPEGKIVRLKNQNPNFHQILLNEANND